MSIQKMDHPCKNTCSGWKAGWDARDAEVVQAATYPENLSQKPENSDMSGRDELAAKIENLKTTIQTLQSGNIHLADDLQRAKREISGLQNIAHVTDDSSYRARVKVLVGELEAANAERDLAVKAMNDAHHSLRMAGEYGRYVEAERARSRGLVETLRKIADPRLRDHKEPDKYTECGCMMHMAEEALAEYENTNAIKDN